MPGQPSNPVGYGLANFAQSFADEASKGAEAKRTLAGQKEFEKWKSDLETQKEGTAKERTQINADAKQKAAQPKNNVAGMNTMLKQDQQALAAIDKATANHKDYVSRAMTSNLMMQTMNPDDPRYTAFLDAINDKFLHDNPADATLLQHADAIRSKIFSRNPTLREIYPQHSQAAPAPTANPNPAPQANPAPAPQAPPSQGLPSGLPAMSDQTNPAPQVGTGTQ